MIAQTAALVKGYLKDNDVRLELDLPPDLPVIMGSPQELSQVFMNLITNSVESLNADPTYADRRIAIEAQTTVDQVVVRVTDTGIGIGAEDMARVFDAFFTSKKDHGASGVGLSICHRIIEGHNGTIEAHNRSDRGGRRLPSDCRSTTLQHKSREPDMQFGAMNFPVTPVLEEIETLRPPAAWGSIIWNWPWIRPWPITASFHPIGRPS